MLKNATVINEGEIFNADIIIKGQRIHSIDKSCNLSDNQAHIIDCSDKFLIPGVIDDQVHFREPGLTHKANIATESRAAVAGGVTTFMEMPNTQPPALTVDLLEDKYKIAAQSSPANYSFFMGVSNDNADEVLRADPRNVCGIKIFMGSSTGNMLVDNEFTLRKLFKEASMLIAVHCEDENLIHQHMDFYKAKFGDDMDASFHPVIRDEKTCYASSSFAVNLAKEYNTRLHILHISTAMELSLFRNDIPLSEKRITSEVCVHHLTFSSNDYLKLGNLIKCNPAIKEASNREALWKALNNDTLDIIATDHAPHTSEEKSKPYLQAPSGIPLVQHSLQIMLDHVKRQKIELPKMVQKMCHAPADCFQIKDRGYIREGYFADLVLIDPDSPYTVQKNNLLYKCAWSPFEGHTFQNNIAATIVSGNLVWMNGKFLNNDCGLRLEFNR